MDGGEHPGRSATGATGWFCLNSTVVTCGVSGLTWAGVLDLLPDQAVFQNSLGFPNSLIFTAGQTGNAAGDTVRGVVDRMAWTIGAAGPTEFDFEPALISAAGARPTSRPRAASSPRCRSPSAGGTGSSPSTRRWPASAANRSR